LTQPIIAKKNLQQNHPKVYSINWESAQAMTSPMPYFSNKAKITILLSYKHSNRP